MEAIGSASEGIWVDEWRRLSWQLGGGVIWGRSGVDWVGRRGLLVESQGRVVWTRRQVCIIVDSRLYYLCVRSLTTSQYV